jgi:hypothetical protein
LYKYTSSEKKKILRIIRKQVFWNVSSKILETRMGFWRDRQKYAKNSNEMASIKKFRVQSIE